MKNIHPNKLFKSLIHLNKYHLIPNSLYSCVDKVNPVIFIHLKTNNKPFGTLRIRLFENLVPKTAQNYKRLFLGTASYQGKSLSFINTIFDKIYPNAFIHGGNLTNGNHSIYGPTFRDQAYAVLHTKPGLLTSVSKGNTNNSQFLITLAPSPYLDYKNIVFGQVIDGEQILAKIQSLGSIDGNIKEKIEISECGEQVIESHGDEHHAISHNH